MEIYSAAEVQFIEKGDDYGGKDFEKQTRSVGGGVSVGI